MASGGEKDKVNMQNGVLAAASCISLSGDIGFDLETGQNMRFYQTATEIN